MASLKSLNKLPNTRVFIAAEKWMVKPHANRRNIVGQQLPTLLDVTCCLPFAHPVACCCAKFETSQTFQPTTPQISFVPWSPKHSATMLDQFAQLFQHCWELLHPFAHHCQHARNNSQHCCANNVGSCCVRVGNGVQTDATTPNNVRTCSASWKGYNP